MYCDQGGMPLVTGMQPGVKPDRVGDDERGQRRAARRRRRERRRAGGCAESSALPSAATAPARSRRRSARGRTARRGAGWQPHRTVDCSASAMASANASGAGSSTSSPVSPWTTVSSAPPRPSATTGRRMPAPRAARCRSPLRPAAARPPRADTGRASRRSAEPPRNWRRPGAVRSSAARSGPSPTIFSGTRARLHASMATSIRL